MKHFKNLKKDLENPGMFKFNFIIDGLKYTVDLDIEEKSGRVVYAQLIDTMTPL